MTPEQTLEQWNSERTTVVERMLAGELPDAAHARALWDRMLDGLPGEAVVNGATDARWFGNLNVRVPGVDAARLRGIALSWGSACASGWKVLEGSCSLSPEKERDLPSPRPCL